VVGTDQVQVSSSDGLVWDQPTQGPADYWVNDIVWSGSKLMALGLTNTLYTSSDGVSWSSEEVVPSGWGRDLFSVAAGNGSLVVTGSRGIVLTKAL
jgi:hypothetical protein